jgi:hypothetical protein
MRHVVTYSTADEDEVFTEEVVSEFGIVTGTGDWPVISALEGLIQFAYQDGHSVFIPIVNICRIESYPVEKV